VIGRCTMLHGCTRGFKFFDELNALLRLAMSDMR
jgi:hypothetical protein